MALRSAKDFSINKILKWKDITNKVYLKENRNNNNHHQEYMNQPILKKIDS